MKQLILPATLVVIASAIASSQTTDELVNDGKNPENVTTQSMGYDRKSYSPLKQINKSNVKRLVPIWSTSLMNDIGRAGGADGLQRRDVRDQRQVDVCDRRRDRPADLAHAGGARARACSAPTRSRAARATIYNGKLFRVTIDNHLLALDMKTGKQVWNQKFADWRGGLLRHQRADCRQRRADFGHGRRRVHDARVPRRLGSRDRARSCGVATRFPRRASPDRRRGRRTATPGSTAAGRRGARARTIRSSISSTGASATPSRTTRGRAARWTACTPRACWRFGRRPARSPATSSTRRTTCTTWTAPTSTCSPTSRSTASRAR